MAQASGSQSVSNRNGTGTAQSTQPINFTDRGGVYKRNTAQTSDRGGTAQPVKEILPT
jgi:polo-like kinase 1